MRLIKQKCHTTRCGWGRGSLNRYTCAVGYHRALLTSDLANKQDL